MWKLKPGTIASKLYDNATRIRLRFRHRYESTRNTSRRWKSIGMIFSGKHPTQPIMQVLELPTSMHPYFVGTQAHPELTRPSRAAEPAIHGIDQSGRGVRRADETGEADCLRTSPLVPSPGIP